MDDPNLITSSPSSRNAPKYEHYNAQMNYQVDNNNVNNNNNPDYYNHNHSNNHNHPTYDPSRTTINRCFSETQNYIDRVRNEIAIARTTIVELQASKGKFQCLSNFFFF